MILTLEELKKIYFGAYSFKEREDGYLQAYQYNEHQMKYFEAVSEFWFERCDASNAKTLEFSTKAEKISFDYKFLWTGSEDSFEICENGLITDIKYIKDLKKEGKIEFELSTGEKDVIIYLPADATAVIKNFEVDEEVIPAKKNEKVLWLGDSITQGYGPYRSGHTYVSVANRELNYDIINQGIGGYVYDKNSLEKMEGYIPDKIIVSLGTNQYGTDSMKDIEEYYDQLLSLYKGIPILVITPLWRDDVPGEGHILVSFCERLKKIVEELAKTNDIVMIDGFKLVPHLPEYYIDRLHPNQLGAEMYGRNLVKEIERLGF